MRLLFIAVLGALTGTGQVPTLRVYSELTRIGPSGEVVGPDLGGTPRHILSPGVVRGAWASFRIVAQPPSAGKIILDIGQNPENAVKVRVYREELNKDGLPDVLTPVELPYETAIGAERKALTFWLDFWVPREARTERIKVEPQLWYGDDWFTYPMEVRVLSPVLPDIRVPAGLLPPPTQRSDAAVLGPLRAAYCGKAEAPGADTINQITARGMLRRNAFQHLRLAANKEQLRAAMTAAHAADFCTAGPPQGSPEWYLRFRDFLYGKEH